MAGGSACCGVTGARISWRVLGSPGAATPSTASHRAPACLLPLPAIQRVAPTSPSIPGGCMPLSAALIAVPWAAPSMATHHSGMRTTRSRRSLIRCAIESPATASLPPRVAPAAPACILAVVAAGASSPLQGEPWEAVMAHMAQRLLWTDPSFVMDVTTLQDTDSPSPLHAPPPAIVVLVGVRDSDNADNLVHRFSAVPTLVALDCAPTLDAAVRLGGSFTHPRSALAALLRRLPWSPEASRQRLAATIGSAWGRERADDVLFGLLLLIDAFVRPVPQLAGLRAQDLGMLRKMATKCGPQIWECVTDESCKQALDCLNACPPNDQVCSYRCIVTYESPLLEAFSLCVLQKHNCLGLTAEPPALPDVQPMSAFRGQALTHETAEDIFVGWLRDPTLQQSGRLQWSWRVVAGVNAAYDSFPCQYQLFYRGKARNTLWYDPVFKVQKMEWGEVVWRRRHYRVRRGQAPGTFYFSVLDNGVTSNEYWRIVDCTEDLAWALFYYAGAAAAAGQAYSGAVLVTPDGNWPSKDQEERLCAALDAAGIKLWELYRVDNRSCDGAPLELSAKDLSPKGVESSLFEQ